MKLAVWAREAGIHAKTAYRWFDRGVLPVPARRLPTGTILVEPPRVGRPGRTAVYARVSSHDQVGDLDRQVARVTEWASRRGYTVGVEEREVGSGLNGRRRRLMRLLADPTVSTIVVEHRDRLARFGAEYIEATLAACGRRRVVVDPAEATDDLARDMVDVLTSFCARLYGRRSARNRALRALTTTKTPARTRPRRSKVPAGPHGARGADESGGS
jgi:putative resolvase